VVSALGSLAPISVTYPGKQPKYRHKRWALVDSAGVTPVAVIGMGCRLPGGIDSPALLWEALLRGEDLITEVPPDRWDADEYYDPEPGVPGRSVAG